MTKNVGQYTSELGRWLRAKGLSDHEIRDAQDTVEAHVRESGSTAEESFGSPRDYARTFPTQTGPSRHAGWYVAGWLLAALAGALLWLGLDARSDGSRVLGMQPMVAITTAGCLLALWVGALLLRLTTGPRRR